MSLDFTPDAQAAPTAARIRSHAVTEARLILSNGEQHILALVIPLGILIGAKFWGERFAFDFDMVVPSVFALAIWSTCFTSLAISTGFERRYNVLERLAATPLGKPGILLGKAAAIGLVMVLQVAVLVVAALILGWRPEINLAHLAVVLAAVPLAVLAFAGLGLCLSGTARPEVTLAVANLLYLVGIMLGIMIPAARYPDSIQWAVAALPTAALGEALRSGVAWSLLVLAAWAVGSLLIARKVFQWTS